MSDQNRDPKSEGALATNPDAKADVDLTPEELARLDADAPLGNLVRQAFPSSEALTNEDALLSAVQRKLRVRSRGKFYGDGWSTRSRRHEITLAIVMLAIAAAVYLALGAKL